MKTSVGVIILCVVAAVTLSGVSALQQLNSINDLKKIDFGQSVPKHSLLLLYWFANNINIDHNGITLTYDPNTDYGSHHYGNYENMLPRGYRYFTVGNLNLTFPEYVRRPPVREYQGENLDRIIVGGAEISNSGNYRINRVFLTQHIPGTSEYDQLHTYQISTDLLRQIREFTRASSAWALRQRFQSAMTDNQLNATRETWGAHLVCLGLLLFIVTQERYSRPTFINSGLQSEARVNQPGYSPGFTYRPSPSVYENQSYNRANNDNGEVLCAFLVIVAVIFILIIGLALPKQ